MNLCLKSDPACIGFQSLSDPGATAEQAASVATFASNNCPIPPPERAGVETGIGFAGLTVADYYGRGYTQNVANALSQVTGVPNSAITVSDVRPETRNRRRNLAQASKDMAVRATYFVASDNPDQVLKTLQYAAADQSLTKALNNNEIQGSPMVTLKPYLPATAAPPASPASGGSGSSSSFPWWAILIIVLAAILGAVLLGLLLYCCCCRKNKKQKKGKHADYAPNAVTGVQPLPVTNPKPSNNKSVEDYKTPTYYNDNSGRGERTVMMVSSNDDLPVSKSVRTHTVPPPPMSSSPTPSPVAPAPIGAPSSSPAQLHHMNSLGRAPSGSIPASGSSGSFGGAPVPAPVRTTMPARSGSGSLGVAAAAAAGGAAVAAGAVAASAGSRSAAAPAAAPISPARSPEPLEPAGPEVASGGSGSGWATNVRPAAPAAAATAAGAGAAAAAAAKSANPQQAERAKFWAQFNDTWQQVRATKEQRDGDEPGTPSSGTNWTETDFGSPTSKR